MAAFNKHFDMALNGGEITKIMSISSLITMVVIDQFCGYVVPTSREAKRKKEKIKNVDMLSNVMLVCQRPHVFECHMH